MAPVEQKGKATPQSSLVSPSPKPSLAKCRERTRRPSGSAETAVVKCGECFSRKFKAKAALTGSPCVVIEMPYERTHQQGKFCRACLLHGFTIPHERILQVPEEHREKIKELARSINQSNGNGTTRHWGEARLPLLGGDPSFGVRIANHAKECRGPLVAIFEDKVPEGHGLQPCAPEWINDQGEVLFRSVYGVQALDFFLTKGKRVTPKADPAAVKTSVKKRRTRQPRAISTPSDEHKCVKPPGPVLAAEPVPEPPINDEMSVSEAIAEARVRLDRFIEGNRAQLDLMLRLPMVMDSVFAATTAAAATAACPPHTSHPPSLVKQEEDPACTAKMEGEEDAWGMDVDVVIDAMIDALGAP